MSAGFDAVLLDLDGTLIDTAPDFDTAVQRLRRAHGLAQIPSEQVRDYCSYGATTLTRWALSLDEDDPMLTAELLDYYGEANGARACVFAGMSRFTEQCAAQGIAWGIVTNKPRRYTEPLLHKVLRQPPSCVLCPEDVARPKPAADPLLQAAQLLRLTPQQCLYVGDHGRDCQAAHAAGMPFGVAGWGYLSDMDPWRDWNAEYFFAAVDDLAERVLHA